MKQRVEKCLRVGQVSFFELPSYSSFSVDCGFSAKKQLLEAFHLG